MPVHLCRFPGTSGDYGSAPDDAAFSALSDFSVVVLASLDDWTPPTTSNTFMGHQNTVGDQRSWNFTQVNASNLRLAISTDGITLSNHLATAAHGFTDGTAHWLLVTRDATSADVKFYTADVVAGSVAPPAIGSFTQLGTAVNNGITGALHNSTALLHVAALTTAGGAGAANMLDGDVYRALLYTGIYGSGSESLVRDFNPADCASATSWTSATTGETWTLNGGDPTIHVSHTATAVAGTAALSAAGVSAGAGATVFSGAAALPAAGVSAGAGATVFGASASLPSAGVSSEVGGGVISTTVSFPGAGVSATAGAEVIAALSAFPSAGASVEAGASVFSALTAFPAASISASVGATSISITVTFPAADAQGNVEVEEDGTIPGCLTITISLLGSGTPALAGVGSGTGSAAGLGSMTDSETGVGSATVSKAGLGTATITKTEC